MKTPNIETQTDLETLFSKYQLLPVLREQFSELSDDDFHIEVLSQIFLHRQADVETMVGILSPKFGEPHEVAEKLLLACELDFIDFDQEAERFIIKYDLTDDVKAMLERYQYPLPMVIPPMPVKDNFDTGYVSIKGSLVLNGSEYFKDKDLCIDHINRANSVALAINFDVVGSNEGAYVLPTRNVGEDFSDFQKRKRQSDVFYQTSVEVMEGINTLTDQVYLTHKYDRRGRCYASGYHVNTQGTDYNKAVLELADKEIIKNVNS